MRGLRRLLRPVFRRPAACLAWFTGLGLLLAAGIVRLELRTDGAALLPDDSPAVRRTNADRQAFHDRDRVVVLVTGRAVRRLDSREGLRYLERLHASLENVPGVVPVDVRSLASVLDPRPGEPLTRAPRMLDDLPSGDSALADRIERMRSSRLVRGLYLAGDGRAAALYAPVAPEADRGAVVSRLEEWAGRSETAAFDVRLAGAVTAEVLLGRRVLEDLARLVPAMLVVIGGLMLLALGSVAVVAVAMAEVGLVLAATLGAMGWAGAPVTLVTTVLPVVVMTVAVADEVHLLDRFRRHRERDGNGKDARRRALAAALEEVGRPIVLTSLTTAVAFLSFLLAPMEPVRDFGLFTAAGILLAMVLSFTFLPVLILLLPSGWLASTGRGRGGGGGGVPVHERLLLRRPVPFLTAAGLLLAAGLAGLGRLSVQDSWSGNFGSGSELRAATRTYDRHFWGARSVDVVVESGKDLHFHTPEGLGLLEEIRRTVRDAPHVGGVLSPLLAFERAARARGTAVPVSAAARDTLARLADLLHPVSRQLGLHHYLRFDGTAARVRLFVPDADYQRADELVAWLESRLPDLFRGRSPAFHLSGDLMMARATVDAVVTNMTRSVAWTLLGVALLLALAYRSPTAAAATLAPLVVAVVALLGGMGWAGIPLGVATSMLAAATIGVGVDFAVHFSHEYDRARREGLDPPAAVAATSERTGRAIRWNAVVLAAGLSVLAISGLRPNRTLGLLFAAAMIACYATTLLILPWLLRAGVGKGPAGSARGPDDRGY